MIQTASTSSNPSHQLLVKDRPILFNTEMVRAILDGRKTQTRRVVKSPKRNDGAKLLPELLVQMGVGSACPFGKPGDRLWVRETWGMNHIQFGWAKIPKKKPELLGDDGLIYRADGDWKDQFEMIDGDCPPWRPSIHMPRWASRITLEITRVRVERLHCISEQDAKAEGLKSATKDGKLIKYGFDQWAWQSWDKDPRKAFQRLWGSVYGDEDFGCQGNPWVWVVEFKRLP